MGKRNFEEISWKRPNNAKILGVFLSKGSSLSIILTSCSTFIMYLGFFGAPQKGQDT